MCARIASIFILLIAPHVTHASVYISEIAWMGTTESANDEWIELHNSGSSPVSLDGWVLEDGDNLTIPLTGTIASGQYAVLERTDDTSASGPAFLIYTGILVNTGATLVLRDDSGTILDQVAGGDAWGNIGGNNETKETPQLTASGWVTAPATPGNPPTTNSIVTQTSTNHTENDKEDDEEENEKDEDEDGRQSRGSSSSNKAVKLELPDVSLNLTIDGPDVAYVNQPIEWGVTPHGLGETIMDSLSYRWNFGDLNSARGKEVTHTYRYTGEYVVTVEGSFARHTHIARKELVVLPTYFSLSITEDEDVQLHNNAKYEIDISGYRLQSVDAVVFPPHTIILESSTITIPKEKIGVRDMVPIYLLDSAHAIVASHENNNQRTLVEHTEQQNTPTFTSARNTEVFVSKEPVDTEGGFVFTENVGALPVESESNTEKESTTSFSRIQNGANTLLSNTTVGGSLPLPIEKLAYLGLLGVIVLGIFAVYATKPKREEDGFSE